MHVTVLLERIRTLAARGDGLFRVHRTHVALYSRARREFGTWRAAVEAAGVDYATSVARARRRSIQAQRRRRRRPRLARRTN